MSDKSYKEAYPRTIDSNELVRKLLAAPFHYVRRNSSGGSHVVLENPNNRKHVTIPVHQNSPELKPGTFNNILNQLAEVENKSVETIQQMLFDSASYKQSEEQKQKNVKAILKKPPSDWTDKDKDDALEGL